MAQRKHSRFSPSCPRFESDPPSDDNLLTLDGAFRAETRILLEIMFMFCMEGLVSQVVEQLHNIWAGQVRMLRSTWAFSV